MAPQDSFVDDDDETCPLCIEELDLSDRNFRPCPCGYQICQFCFNNIKTNMNNLCPACRRPYDDKTIQWKVVTPEEIAEFKSKINQNRKSRAAEQRHKEAQKREAERENRKNLVGVRVIQKNLVYVTGLTPTIREDELLRTLRKPEFFGQYGTIQKISISNRKSSDGQNQSLGVYVTFEKDEEAARCIAAVNNSTNGDRILRAQLGTTKYCSAWLRHEQCTNRQCMFLHELGDEEDSYTRQDLSSMNSISTQRPLPSGGASRSASRQQAHPSPAPAAAQMVRSNSKDESENGDGPALPATANWARNPPVRSRRGSHATSGAAPSPAISNALPVTAEAAEEAVEEPHVDEPVAGPSGSSNSPVTRPDKARALPQDTLVSLLKALKGCKLAWPKINGSHLPDPSYPPLFDPRGGERRRALRDDADSRLAEEQDEPHGIREPSEGEPESSGSLALGGEPEDHGRDSHFDRRPSQPPIQRVNNDGLFGPALGGSFSHATGTLGSIGSRTVTPQQPAFLRPPGAFDNAPPGISAQGSLFPGQGHSRQGSRFAFANDNREASSSTVKISGNPRIMAQQSSMMPSFSHSQAGNYYPTSIPGPPPGLKSTGTPPSMFGPHGFGSAFRGGAKDSNEILQLINQPRAAGNQGHDAGKRELMFPYFPTQYPSSTSSTPAPAASLMSSLYGSQPNGAFQDFGSKQKKKGKKHRHANTSSSGGSGLVDLADPSILQARMQSQHLQQQSNAGLGQGLFGSQAQDDDLLLPEEVATSIDALVSDEPVSATIRQPPGGFDTFVRSTTPSVPPGLGLALPHPHVHASPAISHSSVHGPVGRQTPTPVVLPTASIKSATAPSGSPLTGKKAAAASGSEAKKNIKALAAESGLSKEIAKAKNQPKVLPDEEFPALGTPKNAPTAAVTPAVAPSVPSSSKASGKGSKKNAEKAAKVEKEKAASQPSRANTPKPEPRGGNEKRPMPGILNIAGATKAAAQAAKASTEQTTSTMEKASSAHDNASFPALPTPSAAPVATASPLTRAAPKTLRVVSTPKAETPQTPAGGVPLSATASVRSHHALFRPETPVSEMISDSASIISASISASRTNSPPPTSKVGTAPVRTTTKSQQRKQRKEALKKDTEIIATPPTKVEQEVEIAPIIGRKKKQKKEKEKSAPKEKEKAAANQKGKEKAAAAAVSANATPTASRPETPVPSQQPPSAAVPAKEAKEETSAYRSTANETTTLTEESAHQHKKRIEESRNKSAGGKSDSANNTTPRYVPSASSILRELQEAGLAPADVEALPFFKPVSSHTDRPRSDKLSKNPMTPSNAIVTAEDQAILLGGKPVRKIIDGIRVLLTPNGDCVKNLTPEEEDRFLQLQAEIAKLADSPAAFVCPRHEAPGGFSLIKGRAVPNGPPGYFPQSPGSFPTDPVNKIQREEALTYINQYVLPRLNLNTRDTNFPKGMGAAGDWDASRGVGSSTSGGGGGSFAHAAANLNSLAPWMLGGAAGGSSSDTAAPEVSYPGPVVAHEAFNTAAAAAAVHTAAMNAASGRSLSAAAAAAAAAATANAALGSAHHPPGSFGNVPLMTLEDAESALATARKEADKYEKTLMGFLRKNRRLLTVSSSSSSGLVSGGGIPGVFGGGH
ncbi:general negative regulator of transcription subunit 4 [Rhypophila sp. PSN 637]